MRSCDEIDRLGRFSRAAGVLPRDDEKLVGDLAGAYSSRINIQHRLVYEIFVPERTVRVLRMWTHYE